MKLKNYLLLSGIVLFAAACSNNDDDNNQEMVLKRVEIYSPSKADYENQQEYSEFKEVQYYENGEIVLDSIFYGNGSYYGRYVVATTGNIKIITFYEQATNTSSTRTFKYDDIGRLLEIAVQGNNSTFPSQINNYSYDANGNIHAGSTIYATNETGVISGRLDDNGVLYSPLVFENGNFLEIDGNRFTYYDTVKPDNLQMSTIQTNNYILENGLYSAGNVSKYYIKTSSDKSLPFESTFNNSGYILHTICEGPAGPDLTTNEIFYYYN